MHSRLPASAPGARRGLGGNAITTPRPASLTALESSAEDRGRPHSRTTAPGRRHGQRAPASAAAQHDGTPGRGRAACERHGGARAGRRASPGFSHAGPYTAIALAANAVSELVVGLYAHFSDPVPVAVRRLDYLDREAQLRSLAGQGKAVSPIVARLAATWAPLRPSVVGHGGGTVAAAYGRHVTAMQRLATDPGSAFRREAVHGLNIVDELEAVFSR